MIDGDDYNSLIWQVFLVALIASFTNLYYLWEHPPANLIAGVSQIYFGFVGLIYVSLVIKQFGKKKELLLQRSPKNYYYLPNSKNFPKELSYLTSKNILEFFIFLPLLVLYITTITNYLNGGLMLLAIIVMLMTLVIAVLNWLEMDKFNQKIYIILICLLTFLGLTFLASLV